MTHQTQTNHDPLLDPPDRDGDAPQPLTPQTADDHQDHEFHDWFTDEAEGHGADQPAEDNEEPDLSALVDAPDPGVKPDPVATADLANDAPSPIDESAPVEALDPVAIELPDVDHRIEGADTAVDDDLLMAVESDTGPVDPPKKSMGLWLGLAGAAAVVGLVILSQAGQQSPTPTAEVTPTPDPVVNAEPSAAPEPVDADTVAEPPQDAADAQQTLEPIEPPTAPVAQQAPALQAIAAPTAVASNTAQSAPIQPTAVAAVAAAPPGLSAKGFIDRGWGAANSGNYNAARQEFIEATFIEPLNPAGHYGLGYAAHQQGDMDMAHKAYCKALSHTGDDALLGKEITALLVKIGHTCDS